MEIQIWGKTLIGLMKYQLEIGTEVVQFLGVVSLLAYQSLSRLSVPLEVALQSVDFILYAGGGK